MYDRKPLEKGIIIRLDEIDLKILNVSGFGGSCIVYDAEYYDSQMCRHNVRLKEFYPHDIEIERRNNLLIFGNDIRKNEYQSRFISSAKLQNEIRANEESVNSTADIRDIMYGNGTIYNVLQYYNGRIMSECSFDNLHQYLAILIRIAEEIKKYHNLGYLHLDIKPENVYCIKIPDGSYKILLFDFDSLIKISELQNESTRLSYSQNYAAPELKIK